MLKLIINRVICKVASHKEVSAGSCPYTGMRYNYCERCELMIPIDYIEEDEDD
jgi:hypothetical protein